MKKVIVADDDVMTRLLMKRHLEKLGFGVLLLESGDQVASIVAIHHPVACIIDLVMDGKEGVQTIFELNRQLPDRPKLIAFSQNSDYLELVEDLGADAMLQKPVTLETLQQTLEKLGISAG